MIWLAVSSFLSSTASKRFCHKVCSLLQAGRSKAMLVVMKKILMFTFLVSAFATISAVDAALYKGLDAGGNVVYSDKPFSNAEQYTPPPISVMDALEVTDEKGADAEEKSVEFKYMKFDIISPANNQAIRDEAFLDVSLRLEPGLNAAENHAVWLLMDGKVQVESSKSLSFQLDDVERGAHQIQAQVRDEAGEGVVRTRSVIVYVHRTTVR